jgi:citrate lyase subunit beta/citryl-CoA lyase
VLVSRLADIQPPVDGVSTGLDDPDGLRADASRARALGFGGKLCIHPKQVSVVNRAFSPSAEDVAWATRVLDASTAAGGAAVAVDGRMVDLPVILRARRIIDASARSS